MLRFSSRPHGGPAGVVLSASTLNNLQQDYHDCDDQQDVDEATHGVGTHET
jgi:hypothetical protein